MKKKGSLKPSNLVKRRRRKFLLKFLALVFSLIIILVSIVVISRLDYFKITKINISGSETVSSEDLENIVKDKISGSYFWLLPKDSSLFYPKGAIKKSLLNRFSRLGNVAVSLENLNDLKIAVEEKKPYATWCVLGGAESNWIFSNDCYFMDESGSIFSKAPEFSENVYLKYYGVIKDENPIGKIYKTSFQLSQINDFENFLSNRNFNPSHLLFKDDGDFELYLNRGGVLYFNSDIPLPKTTQNILAFLDQGNVLNSTTTFQYVDLRFNNKIFYKLK